MNSENPFKNKQPNVREYLEYYFQQIIHAEIVSLYPYTKQWVMDMENIIVKGDLKVKWAPTVF